MTCGHTERVYLHAVRALPASESRALEAHLLGCDECRGELASLSPLVDEFVSWPTSVLRPSHSLWERLAQRIVAEAGEPIRAPDTPEPPAWVEPEWEEVSSGIFCKILAADPETHTVSMLVRLAPGVEYPPHTHAGVEELHLLEGELWIDDRKLYAGDYNRAEPGTSDARVWSETGCTCVLVTSTRDALG
jgi:anti-sigma factor ChrR (cupin superfamily)